MKVGLSQVEKTFPMHEVKWLEWMSSTTAVLVAQKYSTPSCSSMCTSYLNIVSVFTKCEKFFEIVLVRDFMQLKLFENLNFWLEFVLLRGQSVS